MVLECQPSVPYKTKEFGFCRNFDGVAVQLEFWFSGSLELPEVNRFSLIVRKDETIVSSPFPYLIEISLKLSLNSVHSFTLVTNLEVINEKRS